MTLLWIALAIWGIISYCLWIKVLREWSARGHAPVPFWKVLGAAVVAVLCAPAFLIVYLYRPGRAG